MWVEKEIMVRSRELSTYGQHSNINPKIGLDSDASMRLTSQFRWADPGLRSEVLAAGDSLVLDILTNIDRALSGNHSTGIKPTPVRRSERPRLMPAVHVLSIGDIDIRTGPVRNGKRSVYTQQHAALKAVIGAIEKSTAGHDGRVVDEAMASVYGELRSRRDLRRREERERNVMENTAQRDTEQLENNKEVVLFEKTA